MSKTLLFLCADHMQACIWNGDALSATQHFAGDAAGREQFTAFLQTHRNTVYLLTDLSEETFRHETVLHLHGRERTRLLQRKLEQSFRNTPFRLALPLQRQRHGRRDDDMLFSALTNPALVTPWLDILLAHELPLAGIYSVPHLSAALIRHIPSSHVLLLSCEKFAGLRQSYFAAGQLRFSRLTPLGDSQSCADAVEKETARTRQYLMSQGIVPAEQILDVLAISHAGNKSELEARMAGIPDIRFSCLDINKLERHNRADMAQADADATALFLHLLATRPPSIHYAAAGHTHFFSLLRLRRILLGCSASVAAACLLWSATNLMQVQVLSAEIAAGRSQADTLSQRTQQIIRGLPATLEAATDMKAAVLLARGLQSAAPAPQQLLDGLSAAMDAFPRIRLASLSWQADMAQAGASGQDTPAVILLNGDLAEFTGDYRDALVYLKNFRYDLVRRGYEVTPLSLPLDTNAGTGVAADTGDGNEPGARFALRIVWKPVA